MSDQNNTPDGDNNTMAPLSRLLCYVRHYRRRNSLVLPELMQSLLRMRFRGSPGQTL
jgi:hypothetical protein